MVDFIEATPILAVRDITSALDRYRSLGFEVSGYQDRHGGEAEYGYAVRGSARLHLSRADVDPLTTVVSIYLYVSDADALHAEWTAAGVDGRFHPPGDTDYGLREAAYVDPDGNLIRFGSWLPGHDPT